MGTQDPTHGTPGCGYSNGLESQTLPFRESYNWGGGGRKNDYFYI